MTERDILAEIANFWMDEDYITAPKPLNAELDPFKPNYGTGLSKPEIDKSTNIHRPEIENMHKDEPEEDKVGGNSNITRKMYIEMATMMKRILSKTKHVSDKFKRIVIKYDSIPEKLINNLDRISNHLYEDIEKYETTLASMVEKLNSVMKNEYADDINTEKDEIDTNYVEDGE